MAYDNTDDAQAYQQSPEPVPSDYDENPARYARLSRVRVGQPRSTPGTPYSSASYQHMSIVCLTYVRYIPKVL